MLTISDRYLAEQKLLHQNPSYGTASLIMAPIVAQIVRTMNIGSISDYGAGKQNLRKGLAQAGLTEFDYYPYDPAFPEYGDPRPAELVCCIDVLEHIEPEYLDAVMEGLHKITYKLGFFSIATAPAKKILSDGRNAHLIQKPAAWWLPVLSKRFEVINLWRANTNILMTVERAR